MGVCDEERGGGDVRTENRVLRTRTVSRIENWKSRCAVYVYVCI